MTDWIGWAAAGVALLMVPVAIGLWMMGRFAKNARGTPGHMIPWGDETAYDKLMEAMEDAHPGLSGIRLVPNEHEALAIRVALARGAERSLDLMYYIWEDDLCGRLMASEVLAAADRGVRVRILIDDVNMIGRVPAYRSMDRHPNIQVRLFNPIRNRDWSVLRGIELLMNLVPYNRRMHNKMFIADYRIGVTGGRNVGDSYFGAPKPGGMCFDDLDALVAGPVLRAMGELYDDFWNSNVALPLRTIRFGKTTRLKRFRTFIDRFLTQPGNKKRLADMSVPVLEGKTETLKLDLLRWVDSLDFLGDPPEKALRGRREGWMPGSLIPIIDSATKELRIMTPYLVPGKRGLARLVALAEKGVDIEIITNGLGRSDSVLVYGAYRWYRPRLLEAGIKLVEAARPDNPDTMLHAKTFVVDGKIAFVGSFNFDMRSAYMNTELGLVFKDPGLIEELTKLFDAAGAPQRGWRVSRDGRLMRWTRGAETTRAEPGTNWWKRALTFCIGHMPIHGLL